MLTWAELRPYCRDLIASGQISMRKTYSGRQPNRSIRRLTRRDLVT